MGWVEYDGRALANPKVYLGNPDLLLVDLNQQENAVYVIDLKSGEITELHGYDYRNASSMPATTTKILSPDVAVEPYTVKFTSSKKACVHVSWALNM